MNVEEDEKGVKGVLSYALLVQKHSCMPVARIGMAVARNESLS